MADPTPVATPQSTSLTSDTHLKAAKDKSCPFCGQHFTSSSLGRHLDLYIRQKNPKSADGVHLVDEIRKLRGGITRRQTKAPIKRELGTPVSSSRQSIAGDGAPGSPALAQSPADDDDMTLESVKSRQPLDDVSWQQLDAANRQAPSALGGKTPDVRRDVSRHSQKLELDQRQKLSDEVETMKATEMALRELLRSVREANAKASGPGLFDFDPYTLNFPSLCLQILPAPSTLFSPTPFSTSESWSINPPGDKQLEALNRQVRERLLAHQRQRQINQVYPSGSHSNVSSADTSPLPTPPLFEPDPQKLFGHIADAYNHWMHLSDKGRQEYWQVEILRSYARTNDLRRQGEINLENARREIEYLKATRWSSGASELSPISFCIDTETVKELGKHGLDYRNWDYGRLVDKWKRIVRETRDPSGMAAQKPLPDQSTRSSSTTSLPAQFCAVNGGAPGGRPEPLVIPAPPTANGGEPSSDQVDAEGEDDDGDSVLDADIGLDESSMNNALHGLPIAPRPTHPSQMHAHIQAQVQVQAQAQAAHAQANAQLQAQAQAHANAQAQAQAQAQMQAQVWAATRQHMNQSRNQHHHQQLSPHPSQHMGSATSSRRPSAVLIDTHSMNTGGMLPMEGMESHRDQFLRMGMGLGDTFVGSSGD